MKNPDNPINRFARYLGKGAENLADDLGMGLSSFQKMSANNPEELQRLIEQKTSFSFVKPRQEIENISKREKALVSGDLLAADSNKKNAFRNNDLRPIKDARIFKNVLPTGLPHYTVEDLETGTPLSPGGNLLTQEFAKLLYLDDDALLKLGKLSPVIHLDVHAIGKRCPEQASGKLTIELLMQALRAEQAKITTTLAKERLREILFLEEFAVVENIFAKLKVIHSQGSSLTDSAFILHERYKDWFCSQFNLNKKYFKKAMSAGRIITVDIRGRPPKEAQLGDISIEHLRIGLTLEDDLPAFHLPPMGL